MDRYDESFVVRAGGNELEASWLVDAAGYLLAYSEP